MHHETNGSCLIVALACRLRFLAQNEFPENTPARKKLTSRIASVKNVLIFLGTVTILGAAFSVYFDWLYSQPKTVAAQVRAQIPAAHTGAK